MAIVAFSNADQNWRLAAKAIVAVAVSLLHAFGREGIPPFSRERGAFTDGICGAPALIGKPAGRPALADKIISPPRSILLAFFRFIRGPDLTRVGPALQYIFLDAFFGQHLPLTPEYATDFGCPN